jgi:hypothetical protein
MAKVIITFSERPCRCGKPHSHKQVDISAEYLPEDEPSEVLSALCDVAPKVLASLACAVEKSLVVESPKPVNAENDLQVIWPKTLAL